MAHMHVDQVDVTVEVVRELVATQFPRWADLEVVGLDTPGTVNTTFRLGEGMVARFPLRAAAAAGVQHEFDAARELFGCTRFATPEPVVLGAPGSDFPFPWTILTWLPGENPGDVADAADLARDLAEFVRGVRDLPLHGRRFSGTGRGGDLHVHDAWMAECFERSGALLDVPGLRRLWSRYRQLPHVSADVVVHGDLIPANLLVADGRLVGVLDVGGLGPADPAVDLLVAWHLFDGPAREEFRRAVGCGELDWVRSQAWAFQQSMGLVWYYARSNPAMSALGRSTLDRILADPAV